MSVGDEPGAKYSSKHVLSIISLLSTFKTSEGGMENMNAIGVEVSLPLTPTLIHLFKQLTTATACLYVCLCPEVFVYHLLNSFRSQNGDRLC